LQPVSGRAVRMVPTAQACDFPIQPPRVIF
jgi:hypothetical protein